MEIDFTQLKTALDMFRSAVGLLRDVQSSLPDNEQKATIVSSLSAAERSAQIAEAQIAQSLGYRLCQCTFPPQIMLSIGYERDTGREHFQCKECLKVEPPKDVPPIRLGPPLA